MAKALSVDLRPRVISSVTDDRLSCYRTAVGFGVSVLSAIRWVEAFRERAMWRWSHDAAISASGGLKRWRIRSSSISKHTET